VSISSDFSLCLPEFYVLWMVSVGEYYDSSYRELVFVDPGHDCHAETTMLHAADTTVAVPQGLHFLSAKHLFLPAKVSATDDI